MISCDHMHIDDDNERRIIWFWKYYKNLVWTNDYVDHFIKGKNFDNKEIDNHYKENVKLTLQKIFNQIF